MPAAVACILDALRVRDLLGLVEQVCRRRGVTVTELCGRQRTQAVCCARHEVWWMLRHDPERYFSLQDIGALFDRDHSTVLHGIDAHRARLESRDLPADVAR